eukprot:TRINITY_DN32295_c0_g1_i1.p1 TRINITY_DN32295_c0_g1~~TRINITY_DN32295_c0_g1_i1.p1  ORF type:complete len:414 (+),score=97.05 TRINITY_DN32295_c0_g1_i1:35-1243(+)
MDAYGSPRKTRNFSCATFSCLVGVGAFLGVWRVWFQEQARGDAETIAFGMYLIWVVFLLNAARDPGWIDDQNADQYKCAFGSDSEGRIKRASKSPHSQKYVARFDHFFFVFGYDVGALNHLAHHILILWTAIMFGFLWSTSLGFYAEMNDWHRPWYAVPIVWEFFMMAVTMIETYLRVMALMFSGFSYAIRFCIADYKWLITSAWAYENFKWLFYFVPALGGMLGSYYAMGYSFLFSYHAFLMACNNMTIAEEALLLDSVAIPKSIWGSTAGLHFLLWSEVVGLVASTPILRNVNVYDDEAGEAVPDGHPPLKEIMTWWTGFGTLPSSLNPYNRGGPWANLSEVVYTHVEIFKPTASGWLGRENDTAPRATRRSPSEPISKPPLTEPAVVVHDGLAVRSRVE